MESEHTPTPPTTLDMALTAQDLLDRLEALEMIAFQGGSYDLTLVGIRSRNRTQGVEDFDDLICVLYLNPQGQWILESFPATTDPGSHYLKSPMRSVGCAVLVADRQYRSLWTIGKHRGKYHALKQHGPATIIRDNNRNDVLDLEAGLTEIPDSYIGLNLHRASGVAIRTEVGPWSAGCQVIQSPAHFTRLMSLARLQEGHGWGRLFSYALLNEWRIPTGADNETT